MKDYLPFQTHPPFWKNVIVACQVKSSVFISLSPVFRERSDRSGNSSGKDKKDLRRGEGWSH
jgi:hypothetical protein